jgi:hypothetical protein
MKLLTKLLQKAGYAGASPQLQVILIEWGVILFLVLAPLLSEHVDSFLTRLCINMAASSSPAATIGPVVAIFIWGFYLYGWYRDARASKFPMETQLLDSEEQELKAQGKDVKWVEDFRWAYRRRQYVSIVTSAVIGSTLIMYYQAFVFFILATRHHWDVMKGQCTSLTFSFIEKIYALQFLKDIPFSVADIFDLYGKCSPNTDARPIRVLTSLASSLHWALIVAIVGFVWGKQIKRWFVGSE